LAKDAECAAYIQTTNFKTDFAELLTHDKQSFDTPADWQNREIMQSPLIVDLPVLWNELRETYQKELPKLAFIPVPDEKEWVEEDFGHGRIKQRKCTLYTDLSFIDKPEAWENLTAIVKIEATRYSKSSGQEQKEVRLYITSSKENAEISLSFSLVSMFTIHFQLYPFSFQIHTQHFHLNMLMDGNDLGRIRYIPIGHIRNVNQALFFNTYINKTTEIGNVADNARKYLSFA
jgi:hypothetical protein